MRVGARVMKICGIVILGCCVTACASQSNYGPNDRGGDTCGPVKTLVCEERVNEVVRCTCDSEDVMKEIFERKRR